MSELSSELNRMRTEIAAATEEQSTFLTYDKRVKETVAELTELQTKLADYNLLVDKLNTDTEVILVQQESQELAQVRRVRVSCCACAQRARAIADNTYYS